MSPETGVVVKEFQNQFVGTEEKQGHFIGIFIHEK